MAGTPKDGQRREGAEAAIPFGVDPADPFGMAEWMKNMPNLALHPLMAHPAAAVAAATALGFGLSSHIAGTMFGAMQSAIDAMQKGVPAREPAAVVPASTPVSAPSVVQPKQAAEQAPVAPAAVVNTRKPRAAGAPAASGTKRRVADDLKRISGIGPKLEQVLNGMGIYRFADIAAWSEADVARFDAELGFGGRIMRDDWVGQAKALKGA